MVRLASKHSNAATVGPITVYTSRGGISAATAPRPVNWASTSAHAVRARSRYAQGSNGSPAEKPAARSASVDGGAGAARGDAVGRYIQMPRLFQLLHCATMCSFGVSGWSVSSRISSPMSS